MLNYLIYVTHPERTPLALVVMARRLNLWAICAIVLVVLCHALSASTVEPKIPVGELSIVEIEEQLQVGT